MILRILPLLFLTVFLGGCSILGWQAGGMAKIQFDLNELNRDGLKGSEGSLRSVSYEFCLPANIEYVDEVMAIDKTLVVYQNSPGRVKCGENQYLGMGNTGQFEYRSVLRKLAERDYIDSIHEVAFE